MAKMKETTGIRLAGFGGQGVILAGLLLGQAAVNDGLYAAGSNSYGAQARGSACRAEVVISLKPIDYPHVENANLFVAMSQGGYDVFHEQMEEDGVIFYDSGLVTLLSGIKQKRGLGVTSLSVREFNNKQVANLIWVGLIAGATGWFSRKALESAAKRHVPERFLGTNLQALARGLNLGRDWKED